MYKKFIDNIESDKRINTINENDNYHELIVKLFYDFFENKDNLTHFSHDFLVHDYLNYQKNGFPKLNECILEILDLLHKAKHTNSKEIFQGFAFFQPVTVEMGNKYWSMCKLQRDFSELDKHEYVSECFALIENVCEILIKNFFTIVLFAIRILKGKQSNYSQMKTIKFGNLYNEIKQANTLNSTLNLLESEVSISQWRNIACHKSFQYNKNGSITCKYGEKLDKTLIINSKEELLETTKSIYKISQVINFATKFFFYDNIYDIKTEIDRHSITFNNSRDEDWQLILVTELYAQGLNILKIEKDENLTISVQFIKSDDIHKRVSYIPLIAFKVWMLTHEKSIKIIYVSRDDEQSFSIGVTSDICEKIATGEKDLSYLAESMIVEKLT